MTIGSHDSSIEEFHRIAWEWHNHPPHTTVPLFLPVTMRHHTLPLSISFPIVSDAVLAGVATDRIIIGGSGQVTVILNPKP